MMVFVDNDVAFDTQGESRMMPHLVDWLRGMRWLRPDSVILREFPINGRRVDLVTMTRSGVTSAFELKLGGFSRVLEQAAYNRHSFDRSWIVLGAMPRPGNILEAAKFGVGIIVVTDEKPVVVIRPGIADCDLQVRARVRKKLKKMGETRV